MFPVYRDMTPHPYHNNQTPSSPFPNPNWESFQFPPQINENQSNLSQTHQYWPPNNAYPIPIPCLTCCTHSQPPSYYSFRPPYPHYPPPPYGHFYGGYPPAYLQPYPCVPPPYYSMETPLGFHCCECPNHPSNVKSTNSVKIEEHEPDEDLKKPESLVPTQGNKSSYPSMWVPPECMKKNEVPRSVAGGDEKEKPNQSIQAVRQNPNDGYQWFPLDVNSIRKLMEGEDVMKSRGQEKKDGDKKDAVELGKNDRNNKQFSYPVIWMPPYEGKREDHIQGKTPSEQQEERNNTNQPIDEFPSSFNGLNHSDNEPVKERNAAGDNANETGSRVIHKPSKVRVIPVKQLDDYTPKALIKEEKTKVNENLKETEKNHTKKSKLPPICLRVDPPKKKNPPPEIKHQKSGVLKEEKKDQESRDKKEEVQVNEAVKNDQETCSSQNQSKSAVNTVEKSENGELGLQGVKEERNDRESRVRKEEDQVNEVAKNDQETHSSQDESKSEGKEVEHSENDELGLQGVKESKHEENGSPVKKILSGEEAAIIIQSVYRGYAVRRYEPLKKLRQIGNVREEASKVNSQIEKLDSCVVVDNKEKLAIGETIMNLLLKLDTIQGLHPSVREVRKSVAKELIMLQEKLDRLVTEKPISSGIDSSTNVGGEEQMEAFDADKATDTQSEETLSGSLGGQDVNEDVSEVIDEEPGREAQKEEIVPPTGDSVPLPETSPFEDTQDNVEEVNVAAEFPVEVEQRAEDDIYRMDWECDLGVAKINSEIDLESEHVSNGSAESAIQEEMVEEKHVQAESDGEILKENQREICEVENSGTWNKMQKSEAQCDGCVAKTCNEENPVKEYEIMDAPKCTETPVSEQDDPLNRPITEEDAPVYEEEKEVITEMKCNEQSEGVQEDTHTALPAEGSKDVLEALNREQMEREIIEENEDAKLRKMLEKLLASGKEQQDVISNLTAKVADLEKKLSKRNKMKSRSGKRPPVIVSRVRSQTAR